MSDRLDAARHFVDSWDDPEMRRFAEEYAAEQTIDFARLAVAQAEQIKRLQKAVGDLMYDLEQAEHAHWSDYYIGQGEYESPKLEVYGLTPADMEEQ